MVLPLFQATVRRRRRQRGLRRWPAVTVKGVGRRAAQEGVEGGEAQGGRRRCRSGGLARVQMLVTLRPVREPVPLPIQVVDTHEPAGDQRGVIGVGAVAVGGRGVQCDVAAEVTWE